MGKLYVAFSGGKDSVCVYGVLRKAAEQLGIGLLDMCEFEYNVTNVDPPELVRFIRREYPFVHFSLPKKTLWELIIANGVPTQLYRFCCKNLKERGGEGRFCVTGVRWAESVRRKNSRGAFEDLGSKRSENRILNADNDEDRRALEHCIPKRKYVCNPIVDWTDDEVWAFIREEGIRYCSLYDEGYTRLGCIGCPMALRSTKERDFERWPKYKDQYLRTFAKMIERRRERGLKMLWETPEEAFEYFMGRNDYKPKEVKP